MSDARVAFSGNAFDAAAYVGPAKAAMRKLKAEMLLGNLTESSSTTKLADNVYVVCTSVFNNDTVTIVSPKDDNIPGSQCLCKTIYVTKIDNTETLFALIRVWALQKAATPFEYKVRGKTYQATQFYLTPFTPAEHEEQDVTTKALSLGSAKLPEAKALFEANYLGQSKTQKQNKEYVTPVLSLTFDIVIVDEATEEYFLLAKNPTQADMKSLQLDMKDVAFSGGLVTTGTVLERGHFLLFNPGYADTELAFMGNEGVVCYLLSKTKISVDYYYWCVYKVYAVPQQTFEPVFRLLNPGTSGAVQDYFYCDSAGSVLIYSDSQHCVGGIVPDSGVWSKYVNGELFLVQAYTSDRTVNSCTLTVTARKYSNPDAVFCSAQKQLTFPGGNSVSEVYTVVNDAAVTLLAKRATTTNTITGDPKPPAPEGSYDISWWSNDLSTWTDIVGNLAYTLEYDNVADSATLTLGEPTYTSHTLTENLRTDYRNVRTITGSYLNPASTDLKNYTTVTRTKTGDACVDITLESATTVVPIVYTYDIRSSSENASENYLANTTPSYWFNSTVFGYQETVSTLCNIFGGAFVVDSYTTNNHYESREEQAFWARKVNYTTTERLHCDGPYAVGPYYVVARNYVTSASSVTEDIVHDYTTPSGGIPLPDAVGGVDAFSSSTFLSCFRQPYYSSLPLQPIVVFNYVTRHLLVLTDSECFIVDVSTMLRTVLDYGGQVANAAKGMWPNAVFGKFQSQVTLRNS